MLQAARGPVPSLAEAITGETIRGSWWGHAKGHEIFHVSEAICESPEVLICKLIEGKVTYNYCVLASGFCSRFSGPFKIPIAVR